MQKSAASQKNHNYQACVTTPFAQLGLRFENETLVAVDFLDKNNPDKKITKRSLNAAASTEAKNACEQITLYCLNKLPGQKFNIKVKTKGTPFQNKVWRALQKIPAGQVLTYGQLAKKLNTSARAVGNACRNNPVPVVIPCHRVISSSGIGGFSGATEGESIQIKKWLLEHEGVHIA